ncbi:MAG TPA: hypothetical protein VF056_14485 [Thermoleophilaceae bacterium]
MLAPAAAQAALTLSTSNRLDDRRYVASGTRGYVVGSEAGRFPASGWHIRGEMGGVWTPPLKLLDGIWFGIDGDWAGPATRFTSGFGYTRMDLPGSKGLVLTRTDFVPDGPRAALFGLTLRSTGGRQTPTVTVDAHSELMGAYPWGWTTPNATSFNQQDTAAAADGRLVFSEQRGWTAVVGAREQPLDAVTGPGFRGPQEPPVICPMDGPAPPRCDDSAAGKGVGGRLRDRLDIPARGTKTLWIAVAGSEHGATPAIEAQQAALADPDDALAEKIASRESIAARTQVDLPDDRLLQQGIEWSKQNLADSVHVAQDLQVRWTNEGRQYPEPLGVVPSVRFFGAGFPDYPWLFATDGEFTAFAAVAAGQFDPIADHLRALRDVSVLVNPSSGKVVHEVVTDGSGREDDLHPQHRGHGGGRGQLLGGWAQRSSSASRPPTGASSCRIRTSSPAPCPRSRRPRTTAGRSRRPSTTAPWSSRSGAPTARSGRWCTSSSACGPTWAGAPSRSCRRCLWVSRAWPARTSGSRRERWT